jgi:hypothetical protein
MAGTLSAWMIRFLIPLLVIYLAFYYFSLRSWPAKGHFSIDFAPKSNNLEIELLSAAYCPLIFIDRRIYTQVYDVDDLYSGQSLTDAQLQQLIASFSPSRNQ